jgi:6-phosphogluconolactonase/glucosamine-6-phosphate isomerase/deaminase
MKVTCCGPDIVLGAAVKAINKLLKNNNYLPILLLLSGGSAFRLLQGLDTDNLGKHITISVLDERFCGGMSVSNYFRLENTEFFLKARLKDCNFLNSVPKTDESIDELVLRLEQNLKYWKEKNNRGIVVITQGIGEDGHTAGIMPYPKDTKTFINLFETDRWVVGYDAGEKNKYPLRVTTTITFLKQVVDYSIVYVIGAEKKEVLQKLFSDKYNIYSLPAKVVFEMKDAELFTDQRF